MTTPFEGPIVSIDQAFVAPHAPAVLWEDLVRGRARVHAHRFDHEWMALQLVTVDEYAALSDRSQTILSQTFAARAQKVVSIQRGIAPSTVTGALRHALAHLGLECAPSRIPFLLLIAAEAGLIGANVPSAACVEQRAGDQRYTTLLLHDPSAWLMARLSTSEAAVARLRLHGSALEVIAQLRGRAVRTIANQLASAYRKLRVCGCSELQALLIKEYLKGKVPPPPTGSPARPSLIHQLWPDDTENIAYAERAATG